MIRTLVLFLLLMCSALATADNCTVSSPEEFASFFSKFSDNKMFSVERTKFPLRALKWEYGIDSKGKDESGSRRFNVSKEKYAAMPSISTVIKEQDLTSQIKSVQTRVAVVDVFKESSDWFSSYHFKRVGNCWYLYEYQAHSL